MLMKVRCHEDGLNQAADPLCTIRNTAVVPFRYVWQPILKSRVQLFRWDRSKAL